MNPAEPDRGPDRTAAPGLYVHVPFCASKCAYCDFASRAGARPEEMRRWLDGLRRELALQPDGFAPATLYIGGGTPTALPAPELEELLALLRTGTDVRGVTEWTCEANPGTLNEAKLARLRAGGVNRLSLGAQSFDARNLAGLGRCHTARDIGDAVRLAHRAGFEHYSLDLIYALPFAPADVFASDLERALDLAPEHLSVYALTVEEGTPLAARVAAGVVVEVEEEIALGHYVHARDRLRAAGFEHYEISNFARPGRASRHNLLYWSGGEYLGLGPAAHSHWRGLRWGNPDDLESWAGALERGAAPRTFEERLTPEAAARETLVFGLRRIAGVDRDEFRRRTGFELLDLRGPEIEGFIRAGLLAWDGPRLRLTAQALFISDTIFAGLI